jgi:uncharacterized protein YjiK
MRNSEDEPRLVVGEGGSSASPRRFPFGSPAALSAGTFAFATVLVAACLSGCSGSDPAAPPLPTLPLIASFALDINEPSDLAINETGTLLWTVSNGADSVYQLDTAGKRLKALNYDGQDLEGVAYDPSDHTLWVAEENQRALVHMDLDGNVIQKHFLALTGEQNSGLEGVSLDGTGRLVVLNEKLPGMFIQLNPDVTIAFQDTLTFAGDYSGITYDPAAASFWIVSDQSHRLYRWTRAGGVSQQYDLPFPKPEGVAFDPTTNRIYIVSDSEKRMYVYQYTP